MVKTSVSILGCGWLGSRIQKILTDTFTFRCATSQKVERDFWKSDVLILAMPPSSNMLENYREYFKTHAFKQVILLSSTSCYSRNEGIYNEHSELQTNTITNIELAIKTHYPNTLILRLAGLMGENRIGGAKVKSIISDGGVNYVHFYDIAMILKSVIEGNIKSDIFNVVAPEHPLRSKLFLENSKRFHFKSPQLEGLTHRIISGKKLEDALHYSYTYQNPIDFWSAK